MTESTQTPLHRLKFDNRFIDTLPADPNTENRRRTVKNACYSLVNPTPVKQPQLVACSADMMRELGLDHRLCQDDDFVQVFAGNRTLPGMRPYAMCYGGHQFGNWAGQLGDGRAILLGDVINGEQQRWSLQLKGAGPTPYSRSADGLAVLRSSLREFVCSEAMYHLGIPTTRALSLILTGESVVRDMFYDGHPAFEPGAVVCRVAPSFTRFGNFQILAAQGDMKTLRQLADYTIQTDFPHLGPVSVETYIRWFEEICTRSADMVVHWMRVGFVHGVMNTDNMSILGLTIDYGPYGWLEDYDPDWTPNTTDANGRRYRYANQPPIAQWNLLQLAQAIYPLIEDSKPLEQALQMFSDRYQRQSEIMLAAKLGFENTSAEVEKLTLDLLKLLPQVETDMTLFYRALAKLDMSTSRLPNDEQLKQIFSGAWYSPDQISDAYLAQFNGWLQQYMTCATRLGLDDSLRKERMNRVNPKYVFRNYIAQLAIDKAEEGDFAMVNELLEVFRKPYDEQPEFEHYAAKRPEWARHRAGCSMLSCSS